MAESEVQKGQRGEPGPALTTAQPPQGGQRTTLTPAEAKQVRALVTTPATVASVEQDIALGKKVRLDQTPTLIITYRLKQYPLAGAVNYNLLSRFLDDLLAK